MLIVLLLALASVACITGGGGGGDGSDAIATEMAEAAKQDATATFGAQVFEAQLTAIADDAGK